MTQWRSRARMAQAWVQDMSLSAPPPQLRTVEGGPPANQTKI